jgi:hypothetical protein
MYPIGETESRFQARVLIAGYQNRFPRNSPVVRPPANTGFKAGAQTFALPQVQTEFTVPVSEPGRAWKPVAEI